LCKAKTQKQLKNLDGEMEMDGGLNPFERNIEKH
jgi:hypothetical protein